MTKEGRGVGSRRYNCTSVAPYYWRKQRRRGVTKETGVEVGDGGCGGERRLRREMAGVGGMLGT